MSVSPKRALLSAVVATCVTSSASWSFTLETAFSTGCHERITLEALQRAGWPGHATEPNASPEDIELARNLPFQAPPLAGRWTLSLLLGVRSNDLHGYAPTDFQEFSAAQMGEDAQEEHCLRGAADDAVEGDVLATQRCLSFILNRSALALGADEEVNLAQTERARVALRYQNLELEVTRFAYRAGQALHAIQDSYTHTLREPHNDSIIHIFNYVDPAIRPDYSAARDGFGHLSKLDDCGDHTPEEQARRERAIAASAAYLAALASPATTRLEHVEEIAASLISYQPGCNPENAWCDAAHAEAAFQSCSATSGGPLLLALALLVFRRRMRAVPWAAAATIFATAAPSSAMPIGAYVGGSASVDRTALAASLGVRADLTRTFQLGVEAEFNPWFDLLSAHASLGVFNAYATGSFRWFNHGILTLHSTLKAGASVLLFDAVGVPAGSTGIFVGASLLGLSLDLGSNFFLVVDPLEVVAAVPSLKGVPLIARQYRLGIGLERRF